jgi:hypothetical protein
MPSASVPAARARNVFILRNSCQFGFTHSEPVVAVAKAIHSYLARNNDTPGNRSFRLHPSYTPSFEYLDYGPREKPSPQYGSAVALA